MARRAKGEGSLYQARDKSWVYQYNENGARKTRRFKKKSDANLFIRSLAAEDAPTAIPEETPSENRGVTVGAWLDRWLEHYARPTVKLSTYCSYELYIRAHIKPALGREYLRELTVDNLQDFFNERGQNGNLKGDGGLSAKTLTNMRNMLHLALAQAVQNGLISSRKSAISITDLKRCKKDKHQISIKQESREIAS